MPPSNYLFNNKKSVNSAYQRLGIVLFLKEITKRLFNTFLLITVKNVFKRKYYIIKTYDHKLKINLQDKGISQQLMIKGEREPEHHFILEKILTKGMITLDIGANLGDYAVFMAKRVGIKGKVYAIEPNAESFHLLKENIALNGVENIVEINNIALAKISGVANLYIPKESNWSTLVPVPKQSGNIYSRDYMKKMEVDALTVNDFFKNKSKIELVRMDVEGYEVEILKQIIPLIKAKKFKGKILFETHPEFYDLFSEDFQGVLDQILNSGYRVKYIITDEHRNGGQQLLDEMGYNDDFIIKTFTTFDRAIYENIKANDCIKLISKSEFIHAALLESTEI